MKIELISYSQPAMNFADDMTDLVAFCARVSNPSGQMNKETNDRLIKYLIKNQHWSPLEMVNVCLEIETTRDIARQMLRHRSFSFQEFSQRYAATETMGDYRETRLQDLKNRQNSLETDDEELDQWWKDKQDEVAELAFDTYDQALKKGIAKEQVRAILPEGLTWSRLYVNGTLRSWIHYIELRTDPSTQKEHRDLAKMCAREIDKVFPMISDFVQD